MIATTPTSPAVDEEHDREGEHQHRRAVGGLDQDRPQRPRPSAGSPQDDRERRGGDVGDDQECQQDEQPPEHLAKELVEDAPRYPLGRTGRRGTGKT
jgi:hypothetical protein